MIDFTSFNQYSKLMFRRLVGHDMNEQLVDTVISYEGQDRLFYLKHSLWLIPEYEDKYTDRLDSKLFLINCVEHMANLYTWQYQETDDFLEHLRKLVPQYYGVHPKLQKLKSELGVEGIQSMIGLQKYIWSYLVWCNRAKV